jgi:hypothetical protein
LRLGWERERERGRDARGHRDILAGHALALCRRQRF